MYVCFWQDEKLVLICRLSQKRSLSPKQCQRSRLWRTMQETRSVRLPNATYDQGKQSFSSVRLVESLVVCNCLFWRFSLLCHSEAIRLGWTRKTRKCQNTLRKTVRLSLATKTWRVWDQPRQKLEAGASWRQSETSSPARSIGEPERHCERTVPFDWSKCQFQDFKPCGLVALTVRQSKTKTLKELLVDANF